MTKLTVIQMCSTPDVDKNLAFIEQQLASLEVSSEHVVVLPECCLFFGSKDVEQLALAQATTESNALVKALSELAGKYRVTLVAGSIPMLSDNHEKYTNTCFVFDKTGAQLSRYDKIHLFDVTVDDGEKNYLESRYTQPGDKAQLVEIGEVTLGLTICYDLRFPELFRHLTSQGANVITVPSAFTRVTGAAHWQVLLRARAIENQVYIVAAGQSGVHVNGRETWGHSVIISPWGDILTSLEEQEGHASASFCLDTLNEVRNAMPVNDHNQFITKLKNYE
ncbi:carbon-nitrogen hydrolase family protein [Thalassotalea ganghwensis]